MNLQFGVHIYSLQIKNSMDTIATTILKTGAHAEIGSRVSLFRQRYKKEQLFLGIMEKHQNFVYSIGILLDNVDCGTIFRSLGMLLLKLPFGS
jgi:hypothetical protein